MKATLLQIYHAIDNWLERPRYVRSIPDHKYLWYDSPAGRPVSNTQANHILLPTVFNLANTTNTLEAVVTASETNLTTTA